MSEPVSPQSPAESAAGTPLVNLFEWQKRAIITALIVVALSAALIVQNVTGWWQVVLVLVLVGGGYAAWSWLRGQHTIRVDGGVLHVGRPGKFKAVRGADVKAVKYVMNRDSPDFTLVTATGRYTVCTSRLDKGHSTLFAWLRDHAPDAQLDKRSERIREMLQIRGLLDE